MLTIITNCKSTFVSVDMMFTSWPVEVEPADHFLLFEGLLAVNTGGYISIIRVEQK